MKSRPIAPQLGAEDRTRTLLRFDWWLLLAAFLLILTGLLSQYSIQYSRPETGFFTKQLLRTIVGLVPFFLFLRIPARTWQRGAWTLYALNIVLLGAVLVAGRSGGGATRWIQIGPLDFQPSEMAKLFVTLTVATFFAARTEHVDRFSTFALSFLHVLVPMLLIFKQPHLGGALVILVIWLSICTVARVPGKFIVATVAASVALLASAFTIPGIMTDYQKARVIAMFRGDDSDGGYQSLRAQIAFGVGGVAGSGYLKGEQKEGRHIPEQQTDFIFTVVGEEGGLVGSALVLAMFGFFLYRVWLVMLCATEPFAKMVAGGLLGLFSFHTIVNLGMNLQLLPVVGLWLPFLSYGGTAMWLCMAAVGLLLNLRQLEKPVLF
ncbi:MAG: rod shape-determining protein RodA [Fimbriimonadaceae bacterium]|nr:rod shape-determining protein RodA [Chthonomonadaceae bacterium]MCO5297719.1 rod shape-determining protein RodA [Fimbriimonadaceae bacterium]